MKTTSANPDPPPKSQTRKAQPAAARGIIRASVSIARLLGSKARFTRDVGDRAKIVPRGYSGSASLDVDDKWRHQQHWPLLKHLHHLHLLRHKLRSRWVEPGQ